MDVHNPEPGQYTPNYDAVYKKSPITMFDNHSSSNNFTKTHRQNFSDLQASNENINISIAFKNDMSLYINKTHRSTIDYTQGREKNKTLSKKEVNKDVSFSQKSPGSNTKGIKFDLCSPRKNFVEAKGPKILSYVEPVNYVELLSPKNKINGGNNFSSRNRIQGFNMDKKLGRSLSTLINFNNVPSPCDYNPDWKINKNHISSPIHFDKSLTPSKQYVFKKILYSFNPSTDFKVTQIKTIIENTSHRNKNKI